MILKRTSSATARLGLLDSQIDSYVLWRDQSRAVADSYRNWSAASGSERGIAFEHYRAALDREEQAAHDYRQVVERGR
jgi:hypothetical protein